MIVNFSKIRLS